MAKCLFCGEVHENDQLPPQWSLLTTVFRDYSQFLYQLTSSVPALSSCLNCFERLVEIRTVRKDITKLQRHLKTLAKSLEVFVLKKQKINIDFSDPSQLQNDLDEDDRMDPLDVSDMFDTKFLEDDHADDTVGAHTDSGGPSLAKRRSPRCKRTKVESNVTMDLDYVDTSAWKRRLKTKRDKKSFKCSHCGKEYPRIGKLRIHERSHTQERPFECTVCHKRFSAKTYLTNHMTLHSDKYACPTCGKRCTNRTVLTLHLTTVHATTKAFICDLCAHACATKQGLESHCRLSHEGQTELEPFKCSICYKRLATKASLDKHSISLHNLGQAKLPCQYCELRWHNARELRIHTESVHLKVKRYVCSQCDQKFSGRANLNKHIERNHVAKDERKRRFQCSMCEKGFFDKRVLENHEAIHGVERPFPCDRCDQRFPSKNYLELHVYTIHDKRQKRPRKLVPAIRDSPQISAGASITCTVDKEEINN